MSDGTPGYGASLKVDATTNFVASTATAIGNIISVGGPNQSRDAVDISTMDSTEKWREFIGGILDAGEVTVDLNYDGAAAGTANDLDAIKTNATQYWRITFNDHTTETNKSYFQCDGIVTGLGHAIPFDDKVTQSLTLKLSGKPTFTDIPA